ncbi:MAG TPA: ROK family protein [Rubricoccaceae bacterium]|nr:ROK family protein [Rubricoccaceae bacterium]
MPDRTPDRNAPVVVGVDLGGTGVKAGLVDHAGHVLDRFTLKTADFDDPRRLVEHLASEIEDRVGDRSLVGVGVGAPNGNGYRGTVENPPNLPWRGVVPLAAWLGEATGVPSVLANDANAAALGEQHFGAARGMRDFLFITLGTGLGSGIVVAGELVCGHDGFAGELGHVIVEKNGRRCGCGRRGCLEQYASATGLVHTYRELAPGAPEEADARYVFERAEAGEAAAEEAFERTAETLGLALANSVAYTEPEAIFLFGGLAAAGERLFGPVRRHFEANLLMVYRGKTAILPSALPESDAAILGAASLLWKDQP